MKYIFYPLKRIIIIFSILRLRGFSFLVDYYSEDLIIESFFFFKKINLFFNILFVSIILYLLVV